MRRSWLLAALAPLLASCSQPYSLRFPDCAFATRPQQRVIIITARGRTEIHGVIGSRDIVVSGTVNTIADSMARATALAGAVKVIDTSIPQAEDGALRLEVTGIPPVTETRLEAVFRVPKDIRLEILDGPEDLIADNLEAGITVRDGAGDISLSEIVGPIEIEDSDGDVQAIGTRGPIKIDDRRGNLDLEEITGNIDVVDREGDVLVQSVSGDVSMSKRGRGMVRIINLDGKWEAREWDNPIQPVIDIWPKDRPTPSPAGPAKNSDGAGKAAPAPSPVPEDVE